MTCGHVNANLPVDVLDALSTAAVAWSHLAALALTTGAHHLKRVAALLQNHLPAALTTTT